MTDVDENEQQDDHVIPRQARETENLMSEQPIMICVDESPVAFGAPGWTPPTPDEAAGMAREAHRLAQARSELVDG